jgi:hypothetical protein
MASTLDGFEMVATKKTDEPICTVQDGRPSYQKEATSPKVGPKTPKYVYFWTWACDNCGVHGGMTTQILHCPGCDHLRCSSCPVFEVKQTLGGGAFVSYAQNSAPTQGLPPSQSSSEVQGYVKLSSICIIINITLAKVEPQQLKKVKSFTLGKWKYPPAT